MSRQDGEPCPPHDHTEPDSQDSTCAARECCATEESQQHGEIAANAEFFSFGTNDLTQTALGFSRDDIEGRIVPLYMDDGILDRSPFGSIDEQGVGALVKLAVERGRAARPGLEVGICGEHGGDPRSIGFFHTDGLDYISCSPYRVPIARVAAAQAALKGKDAS